MSDLSIIAHDYELNAEFARSFNEAVLNLKRADLLQRPTAADTQIAINHSRTALRNMLEPLVAVLKGPDKEWTVEKAQVPADVLERLHKCLKGELPETINELSRAAESLKNGSPLDAAMFAALDRVCEAADATASAAFRRLRRI